MKINKENLKEFSHTVMALVDYLITQAVWQQKPMEYRLRVPWKNIATKYLHNDGDIIVEVKITYDGKFTDEPSTSKTKTYIIPGKNTTRQ
jgi:hypothetical protein